MPTEEEPAFVNNNKAKISGQQPVNIKNYKPIYGPSNKQLAAGLWWIKNKALLRRIGYGLIILFNTLTLGYGVIGLGLYIFSGIKQDDKMFFELSQNNFNHGIVAARAAEDLSIGGAQVFYSNNNYNFAAEINNPNNNWHAEFDYFFIINQQSTPVRHEFILPGEKKYLTEFLYPGASGQSQAAARITNIFWRRIRPAEAGGNIQSFINEHLAIEADNIEILRQGRLNRINFDLINNTAYNYWEVDLYLLIKSGSRLVDINKYQITQLKSGEERKISVLWPGNFPGSRVEIVPSVNVFNEDSYMEFDLGAGQEK